MDELLPYQSGDICLNGETLIRDVSFALHPGEILCIAGESGSGKSSLLKAALGLLGNEGRVTKGDIWFQGLDLPDLKEREFRPIRGAKIGMIFQDPAASFCPIRTIGSQIFESLRAHRKVSRPEARQEALELFHKMGFSDGERIWNSYPFELSGGMNQRVAIASAMLMKPLVLLADEPTSALDAGIQKQVATELIRLREMFGTAILFVTHDMGVVSAMADTLLVLKDGEMMEYGSAKQILHRPQNPYTRELLAAVPKLRRV